MFKTIGNISSVCEKAGIDMPKAALSWALQQPPVSSVIVGASKPEQVGRNVELVKIQQVGMNFLSLICLCTGKIVLFFTNE